MKETIASSSLLFSGKAHSFNSSPFLASLWDVLVTLIGSDHSDWITFLDDQLQLGREVAIAPKRATAFARLLWR